MPSHDSGGAWAETAANGTYTVGGLSAGSFEVSFDDPSGTYALGYYNSAGFTLNRQDATPVSVPPDATGIDVELPLAGGTFTLSGTVTAAGTGVAGAIVYVFDGTSSAYVGNATTTAGGAYSLALPPGAYKLWVQTNTPGYPDQAYGGDRTFAGAEVIDLTAANATADVVLAGGTFTLSGTVTAAGTGVAGAIVYVFDGTSSAYVGNATTTAGGAYSLALPPGTYKLWVQTNTPGYPDQAYGGDRTFAGAEVIDLTAANATADVVLAGGTFTISGTVTAAGTGVPGAIVYVFDGTSSAYVGNATTTAGGAYSLALPPGAYKLWIQTNTPGYPDQAYGGDRTFAGAEVIDLTAANATADVVLAGGTFTLSGTVTAAGTGVARRHRVRVRRDELGLRGQRHHHRRRRLQPGPAARHLQAVDPDQHAWLPRPGLRRRPHVRGRRGDRPHGGQRHRGRRARGRHLHPLGHRDRRGHRGRAAPSCTCSTGRARPTWATPPPPPAAPTASPCRRAPTSCGSRPTRLATPTRPTAATARFAGAEVIDLTAANATADVVLAAEP